MKFNSVVNAMALVKNNQRIILIIFKYYLLDLVKRHTVYHMYIFVVIGRYATAHV